MKTIVQQITELEITGNIIPMQWFKKITFKAEGKKGKVRPHLLAINILADIVYWYKAKETRDERSGQVRKFEKKFAGHKLQRSYGQLANTFGVSKEQARIACKVLESHGLIKMELRNLDIDKRKLINVLFLEPVPAKIFQYTYEKISEDSGNFRGGYGEISGEGYGKISGQGMAKFPDTYTEISSTEISNTQISIQKEKQTETHSESSNPDKETKIQPTKEQDTPEKRKISHSETISGDDLYKDGQESLELARIGLNSIIPFSEIANEISTKRFRKTLIDDNPSQITLGQKLKGNCDDFRKLCEYMLADDFYKKLGFTYKNLLSCYAHRNDVLTSEPVKKTAYNTRDFNSPEYLAEKENIRIATENRQNGVTVPFKKKTIKEIMNERKAREAEEKMKHAV